MKHAKLNHNKQFMFGIMAMSLVVIGVVVFFWMWCFPQDASVGREQSRYEIRLVGFSGDSVQVALNDEMLLDAPVSDDTCILHSDYEAKEVVLMVGSVAAGQLATFEVSVEDAPVWIYRNGNEIIMRK